MLCVLIISLIQAILMSTQNTIISQKIEKTSLNYSHLSPDLVLQLTHSGLNYPCLEQIFMVPKIFKLMKFNCIFHYSMLTVMNKFVQYGEQCFNIKIQEINSTVVI